ncbi:MAG: VCBS repeat-containing protein [Acidobacteria bacterium]|nr:VCBS repeat-containing protein [Acidobacteriota bacterium]
MPGDADSARRSPPPGPAAGAAPPSPPTPTLPKGGGAIHGIGEKFAANPVTGTSSLSVPLATSPGRSGFGPQLSLSYDSCAGSGPFGFGWSLSIPAISRKTDRGLPQYRDAEESDVYILAGAEDLVPLLKPDGTRFEDHASVPGVTIHRYRPRIEGLFARIERWTDRTTGEIHWRSITRDNVTTLYGKDDNSRVFDPADPDPAHPTRIFEWLPCQGYDDKGNALVYEYAAEDDKNVDRTQANERNRVRPANRYLKRVRYGNRVSRLVQSDLTKLDWLFEVVFDYDEGHYEELGPGPVQPEAGQVRASASKARDWTVRPDPFSSHRAGFEVRSYRRCRRVLMFHRFAELGAEPCLVSSTEFDYKDLDYSQPVTIEAELAHPGSTRLASFLRAVIHSGFIRDETQPVLERDGARYLTYFRKSLPPLEFEYSQAIIQDDVRDLDPGSLENLPAGLDGTNYQWVDLNGEGLSGILTEQADAWFYKPNLGDGHFGPLEKVATKPSLAALSGGRQQLVDLAGDGQLDLAAFGGPTPGFFKRTPDEDWELFRPFSSLPGISWDEPNLRFLDLDGDGHADVLITEDEVFTWYPSLAEEGFGPARQVRQAPDEERGPRLVLADGTQSIYLADMCGDGLVDLVRIRNGEVCYWPNQGYGRFGAKITMDDAPWFDHPDQFNQQRVRLADVDGSGVTDILYLGRDGVRLYFNESGNRWSAPRRLRQFPRVDRLSSVMTVDLLGNGTACLVWSSPLPGEARRPLRYVDLMGGQKPHLLIRSINNLGAETRVHYAASTKFYLADKLAGKPWITRLPFPVHVVEKVEHVDHVSRARFASTYTYHHGYFDGVEREFRGFGRVEQQDTEAFEDYVVGVQHVEGTQELAPELYQPPVTTRTWFHTGAFLGGDRILHQLRDEYYLHQQHLPEPVLPPGMDEEEMRECVRALKGLPLRQEVYSFDGSPQAELPYSVAETNYDVKRLQPRAGQRHAVFFAYGCETVTHYYERNLADPRIAHSFNLEIGPYGDVLKSAAVVYGRQIVDPALPAAVTGDQQRSYIACTEVDYTPDIDQLDPCRPTGCARRVSRAGTRSPASRPRPGCSRWRS